LTLATYIAVPNRSCCTSVDRSEREVCVCVCFGRGQF